MNADGTNLLAVGIGPRLEALGELPIEIHRAETAAEAIGLLRNRVMDAVLSRWDLADAPGGTLLENLTAARPGMPAIAVVGPGDYPQEVAARSIGVAAVINDDDDDGYFREAVAQLMNIGAAVGAGGPLELEPALLTAEA
jgi:DNA-binding NtrC family response regulator